MLLGGAGPRSMSGLEELSLGARLPLGLPETVDLPPEVWSGVAPVVSVGT